MSAPPELVVQIRLHQGTPPRALFLVAGPARAIGSRLFGRRTILDAKHRASILLAKSEARFRFADNAGLAPTGASQQVLVAGWLIEPPALAVEKRLELGVVNPECRNAIDVHRGRDLKVQRHLCFPPRWGTDLKVRRRRRVVEAKLPEKLACTPMWGRRRGP